MAARTVKQAIGVARRRRRGESMELSLRSIGICGERMHWHRAASRNPGRLDVDRGGGRRGRVIPHAGCFHAPASAAFALPIAVVESAFGALTMAATGAP
jgi:hypothetical protein